MKDRLFSRIRDGLSDHLDPDMFEACVVDLLSDVYPGLVPISGGQDAGMDGAISTEGGSPIPLVTTTADDVIGNLGRSLRSYMKHAGERREAVLATSQFLTPRRRRNLEKRAEKLGFVLRQIHAGDDIARRIYREPAWRVRLLGIAGDPPALSILPRSTRPETTGSIIGRDSQIEWLHGREEDAVLLGQPGSGKTSVLEAVAAEGRGLFVVANDLGRIADDLRSQDPELLFLDDARVDLDLLSELLRLRREIGARFAIIATCWPGQRDRVQDLLELPDDAVESLGLLGRKTMAEIVRQAGVTGPDWLIGEILDQARGRPGLAVTLASLFLRRGWKGLASGDFVFQDAVKGLEALVGEAAVPVLAGFAVAGEPGLSVSAVALGIGETPRTVMTIATQVAAAGVVFERNEDTLSVHPQALREALVKVVFFSPGARLPIQPLVDAAPSVAEVAATVAGAAYRGGHVPDELQRDLLRRSPLDPRWPDRTSARAWQMYAASGSRAVEWILDSYPEALDSIRWQALEYAPERATAAFLRAALGDERELHAHPEHSLRRLKEWVEAPPPGEVAVLERRGTVLEALLALIEEGMTDRALLARALAIVFSPRHHWTRGDPIADETFTIQSSPITAHDLEAVMEMWERARGVVCHCADGAALEQLVHDWAFPGVIRGTVPDDVAEAARRGAGRMLQDVVRLATEHPGVVAWARRMAERANLPPLDTPPPDEVYEVLFPQERLSAWSEAQEEYLKAATQLADRWKLMDPEDVADHFVRYYAEAELAGHRWPHLGGAVAMRLAKNVSAPQTWLETLTSRGADREVVRPFLRQALNDSRSSLVVLHDLLDADQYRQVAVYEAFRITNLPGDLRTRVLDAAGGMPGLVHVLAIRDEIAPDLVVEILQHESPDVAGSAADGLWRANDRTIVPPVYEAWKAAVLRGVTKAHTLGQVFRAYPEIACEWIRARAGEDDLARSEIGDALVIAVEVLGRAERLELIRGLPCDTYVSSVILGELVGSDVELHEELLGRPECQAAQLLPLAGIPSGEWGDLAEKALEAGHSTDRVAAAAFGDLQGWSGKESDMWREWVEAFALVEEHSNPDVREVGRLGRERSQRMVDRAHARERGEEIFGR